MQPIEAALGSAQRRSLLADQLLSDHGLIRILHPNRFRIDAAAWRSAQPLPSHLAALAARGLRSVVNLRGATRFGTYPLEIQTCAALRLDYRELPLESRGAPDVPRLLALLRLFDEIAYPALFHCKSGSDRVGLAAALYLLVKRGHPLAVARRQLHWRYGHVRAGRTGILDAFLESYAAAGESDFVTWLTGSYDRDAVKRAFRAGRTGIWATERLLRRE